MARHYAFTILFLYCTCTSVLVTFAVSDQDLPPPLPTPTPPTPTPPTPTYDPPPPVPSSTSPPPPAPSQPSLLPMSSPPPPSSPTNTAPESSPPTSTPPVVPTPAYTPSELSPTGTPPALSPWTSPISSPTPTPAPAHTWMSPAPAPTSMSPAPAPILTYAPMPTSTYGPPTPTSTYGPPTPTSKSSPPPIPIPTYGPPTQTSINAPPPTPSMSIPTYGPPMPMPTYGPPTPTSTDAPPTPTSTDAPPTPTSTDTPSTPTYPQPPPTSTNQPPAPTSTYPQQPPSSSYAPPAPQQGDEPSAPSLLKVHFYSTTCPKAEDLVQQEMKLIQAEDSTLMPALVRLHFHDCFVRGCDASVLLVSKNGTAEKDAKPNLSLRGFEAIERLKKILEKECPHIVSCADILAMAAREAIYLSNGSRYDVETGRRDGNISLAKEAYTYLPPTTGNITTLTNLYATKNLTVKDLVVLSGAHTFGVSHCSSFSERLYNYSGTGYADPTLNGTYAQQLRQKCVPNDNTTFVPMSPNNYFTFNLGYFKAVINKQGLFNADEALLHNNITLAYVTAQANANSSSQFFKDFAQSMIHMGRAGVLTGTNGIIRDVCGSYVD